MTKAFDSQRSVNPTVLQYDAHIKYVFFEDIRKFNDMYELPNPETPTCLGKQRLLDFKKILLDELSEVDDLIEMWDSSNELDRFTALSDWLGDMIVYCTSESKRWGIPIAKVLEVIMMSNFSKLGEDGKPMKDDIGKVLKGPSYWKPEPKIKRILSEMSEER